MLSPRERRRRQSQTLVKASTFPAIQAPTDAQQESTSAEVRGAEPVLSSPDSGFSSGEDALFPAVRDVKRDRKLDRSKSLRSALRCSSPRLIRKSVTFADSQGLVLAKTEFYCEAENDFNNDDDSDDDFMFPSPAREQKQQQSPSRPRLQIVNFVYRSVLEALRIARDQKVALTTLYAKAFNVNGQINVLNLAYDKQVVIRYTLNGWKTFIEIPATYASTVQTAKDVDVFNFDLALPVDIEIGTECEFCVVYYVSGGTYWDSNDGLNFRVKVGDAANSTRGVAASRRAAIGNRFWWSTTSIRGGFDERFNGDADDEMGTGLLTVSRPHSLMTSTY